MSFQSETGNSLSGEQFFQLQLPHFRNGSFSYIMSRPSLDVPLKVTVLKCTRKVFERGVWCELYIRMDAPSEEKEGCPFILVLSGPFRSATNSAKVSPAPGHKAYGKSHHLLQELILVLVITCHYKELFTKHVLLTYSFSV